MDELFNDTFLSFSTENDSQIHNVSFDLCSTIGINGNITYPGEVLLTSEHFPTEFAIPLYGYAMPFLVVVTTFANTVIVAVLAQKHMRSPTNYMLMAISMSDLLMLLFPAPLFFYIFTLGHYVYPIFPLSLCYSWIFFSDIIPTLLHTASIWLTLGLAAQRYIYVCHPHVAATWCNIPRVTKSIIWVFVAAFLHQILRCFEYRFHTTCIQLGEELFPACKFVMSQWVRDNINIYYSFYFWFRVFFVHLGPCTLLVVLNIFLFRALRLAQKRRAQLMKEKKKSESKKLRDSNCMTLMLIIIVTVFLVTEIPLAIITLLHLLTSLEILEVFSDDGYDNIKQFFIVSNFFIVFCYPINFAIYCGMSRQFRETFKELFLHGKTRSKREDSSRYTTVVNGNRTNESVI